MLVGSGVEVEHLKRMARESRLGNLPFLPRRPFSEIGKILALAGGLLVHPFYDPLVLVTVPSKTQAYMPAGPPILMGVKGAAADLGRMADAGICFEPGNPQEMARSIHQLVRMSPAEPKALVMYVRNPPTFTPSPLWGACAFVENRSALLRTRRVGTRELGPPPRCRFAPANNSDRT